MGGSNLSESHNIAFNVISGEAADVSSETIDDWKQRIPSIIDGYALEDIYNCDETGLFYRALPDKTLSIKGQQCQGGKRSKERVTALPVQTCTSHWSSAKLQNRAALSKLG